MPRPRPSRAQFSRRGVAMATVLLVVMILGLTVAASVIPMAQESDLAAVRVETLRAFYAAESGANIVLGSSYAGLALPEENDQIALGAQSIVFLQIPADTGDLIIEGRSGLASRRIRIEIE